MTQPTMSEARRYQQLRAHLSYLKLDAAAEVLPRILDEARAERLSLTAALERLLEIEVSATEQRRLTSRMRFACLPQPWTLADFDFSAQPGVDEKLIRDLATLRFLDDASNVLLVGPPGVGNPDMAERLVLGERTVCEVGAVAITEGDRTFGAAAPSFRAERRIGMPTEAVGICEPMRTEHPFTLVRGGQAASRLALGVPVVVATWAEPAAGGVLLLGWLRTRALGLAGGGGRRPVRRW